MNRFEVEALKIAVGARSAWRGLAGLLLLKLPSLIFGFALVVAVTTHQTQLGSILAGLAKHLARSSSKSTKDVNKLRIKNSVIVVVNRFGGEVNSYLDLQIYLKRKNYSIVVDRNCVSSCAQFLF